MIHNDFEVEVQIVDHCNLKCDYCNHFSNIAEPWFMSKEEFVFILEKIKTELYPHGLIRLMILGGEPFLHPQLLEFLQIAKEFFPYNHFYIDVLTNGLIYSNFDEDRKNLFKTFAHISCTPYPEIAEKILNESTMASRLFFLNSPVLDNPKQEKEECNKYKIPCLFIRDYKLYLCPFAGCIHNYNNRFNKSIPITKDDYIDMHELTYDKLQEFLSQKNKNICNYCSQKLSSLFWSHNNYNKIEDYQEIDWKQMFLTDYEKYDMLKNGSHLIKNFIQKDLVKQIDYSYCQESLFPFLNRVKGSLDIIIPYYNITKQQAKSLYENLKSITNIENYHIYLISDCSPYEEIVYDIFSDSKKLKVTFLKNKERKGPGGARQLGLDNSYNKAFFFLDFDDKIINSDIFVEMLPLLENHHIVSGKTVVKDWKSNNQHIEAGSYYWDPGDCNNQDIHCLLYDREFIENNQIRFENAYIAEDAHWISQIEIFNPKVNFYLKESYEYLRSQPQSIGFETTTMDKIFYRILIHLTKSGKKDAKENFLTILEVDNLQNRFLSPFFEDVQTQIGVCFYFAWKYYYSLSQQEQLIIQHQLKQEFLSEKYSFAKLLFEKILDKNLELNINGVVFSNEMQYINLITTLLENSKFKNNFYELGIEKWLL